MAEFNEKDHPREDDGKFAPKGEEKKHHTFNDFVKMAVKGVSYDEIRKTILEEDVENELDDDELSNMLDGIKNEVENVKFNKKELKEVNPSKIKHQKIENEKIVPISEEIEKDAKEVGAKFYRVWGDKYEQYLIDEDLEHTPELLKKFYDNMQQKNNPSQKPLFEPAKKDTSTSATDPQLLVKRLGK